MGHIVNRLSSVRHIYTQNVKTKHVFCEAEANWGLDLDFNHDGEILVQINHYQNSEGADADAAYYRMVSEIALISDISDCESYFFLTDDPQKLQMDLGIYIIFFSSTN